MCVSEHMCVYRPYLSISVNMCLYVNICWYGCICKYLSISVNMSTSVYMFVSVNIVNICPYPFICLYWFICLYLWISCISVHICPYVYICSYVCICKYRSYPSMCTVSNLTVSDLRVTVSYLRDQADVHICAYVINIRSYLFVLDLYQSISVNIYLYMCISVYIQKFHFEGKTPNF